MFAPEPVALAGVEDMAARVGQEIGVTPWHEVLQEDVTAFGEITGDTYWIHTDPERAARESPFGGTVAHGFYTLSLTAGFAYTLYEFPGAHLTVNYGADALRFPSPLLVGGRVRMRATLIDVQPKLGGARYTMHIVFEQEGHGKPVCVADWHGQVWFEER
jgi:acyl dehydratase